MAAPFRPRTPAPSPPDRPSERGRAAAQGTKTAKPPAHGRAPRRGPAVTESVGSPAQKAETAKKAVPSVGTGVKLGGDAQTDPRLRKVRENLQKGATKDNAQAEASPSFAPGRGEPLPPPIQESLGQGLQTDLSSVRVHTGPRARSATQSQSARAMTYGNHIFLGPGERATDVGLVAHEATHVVQQRGAAPKLQRLAPDEGGVQEREARQVSEAMEPAPQAGGGGKEARAGASSLNAECYKAPIEEPAEEPTEKPAEPEPTESREEIESESPKAEQRDDCVVEKAIEQQAPARTPSPASEESAPATAPAEGTPGKGEAAPGKEPGAKASAQEATAATAARTPLAGAIAQSEAQRAEAMASYEAASRALAEARSGVLAFPGDITFAPEPAGTSVDAARRDDAQARANGFFSHAASRLTEVSAFVLEGVPTRLQALAASLQGRISSAMEEQKAAISAGVEQARGAVFAEAEGARQQVLGEHAATVAALESETEAAIASLEAAFGDSLGKVDAQETTTLEEINALYESARIVHEALGTTIGDECIARGEEYVRKYEKCKIGRADNFRAGHLTDRRAEAQQKAARETAKGYKKSLIETASTQAQEAMRGRRQDRCGVIATARRARDTLDNQLAPQITSLESGRDQAITQADTLRDTLLASIESSRLSELARLDRHERDQLQAVNDTGYLQQVVIEQIALSAEASLQGSVAGALDIMRQALASVRGTFAEHVAPDTQVLDRMLSRAMGGLEGGLAGLVARVEGGVSQAEARLASVGGQGQHSITKLGEDTTQGAQSIVESFAGSMATLAGNAASGFGQQRDSFVSQVRELTASGTAGFEQVVAGFKTTCATTTRHIESALEDSAKLLEQGLREAKAGLDVDIPKYAREAAAREQPAWKAVVAVVLIIAVIVVVALVIGPAVIGAVGAAASALGAGAAATTIGALVGGAIVGAATSATIQVINNWKSGRRLTQDVGRSALMGAIGGFVGAGAGALIQHAMKGVALQFAANVAADAVLEVVTELVTGEFSWEALGMSVLMSAIMGGFGEFGPIKRIQQRTMALGAKAVPAARTRAHAEAPAPRPAEAEAAAARPAAEPGRPEGGPSAEARQGAAGAEGRLTDLGELRVGLPSDLADRLPIVRETSPDFGLTTVRVEYTFRNGVITDIQLRVGRNANFRHIAEHVRTVRAMQRYQGISGRVRLLREKVLAWFRLHPDVPPGSRAWEAWLELDKLPPIIEARARELGDPSTAPGRKDELFQELVNLQSQLDEHTATVESMVAEPGRGYVAAEGPSAGAQKAASLEYPSLPDPKLKATDGTPMEGYFWRERNGKLEVVGPKGAKKMNYDLETKKFTPDTGAQAPDPTFPEGTSPKEAYKALGGENTDEPFGRFTKMLIEEGLASDHTEFVSRLEDKTLAGRTHRTVRHNLKQLYVQRIQEHLTNVKRLSETPLYKSLIHEGRSHSNALRAASHAEMVRITRGLGPSDRGSIAERWYAEYSGAGTVPTQVKVTQEEARRMGIELTQDRRLDRISGSTIEELKNVSTALGERDKLAINDQLRLVGSKLTINGQPRTIDSVKVSILDPQGVLANARYMYERLAPGIRNSGRLTFEIYSARGDIMQITTKNRSKYLKDPEMLRHWVSTGRWP